MPETEDLKLLLRSRHPILAIETHEETRAVELFRRLGADLGEPVFRWAITEGIERLDRPNMTQRFNAQPEDALRHVRGSGQRGIYLLLDFHPFLEDPVNTRLVKDIALRHGETHQTLVFLSHDLEIPPELRTLATTFRLRLPDRKRLEDIVYEQINAWDRETHGRPAQVDLDAVERLVRNLAGLTEADARRLARQVIFDDGALTTSDVPAVQKAKYELLNRDGVLAFEYDVEHFGHVGGFQSLKSWLERRRRPFLDSAESGNEPPKGCLLLGVQGGGKSLAARAVAGSFGVPLLRLDFGAIYDKYHGETERKLRDALQTACSMSPCVLWIDEIEKGVASESNDSGTSQRVLGTLLTWMAENKKPVFIVATANDVSRLPPELIRKGRVDEIFFVDLPDARTRKEIFGIHLERRGRLREDFDLAECVTASEGFSGAEIEQAIVSALYAVDAKALSETHLLEELTRTRPLSVVMAEKLAALRAWAEGRTVPAA